MDLELKYYSVVYFSRVTEFIVTEPSLEIRLMCTLLIFGHLANNFSSLENTWCGVASCLRWLLLGPRVENPVAIVIGATLGELLWQLLVNFSCKKRFRFLFAVLCWPTLPVRRYSPRAWGTEKGIHRPPSLFYVCGAGEKSLCSDCDVCTLHSVKRSCVLIYLCTVWVNYFLKWLLF